MRHSQQIIQRVVQMRNNGLTLGEIGVRTGLSKTTIFYHIQSIPKSDFLIQKLRLITLTKQRILAEQRRGKSTKTYLFIKPQIWSIEFVNLVAHFLFDGRITRTSCIYYSRNSVLRNMIKKNMERIMSINDYKIYDSPGGVKRVCYFNVEVASFIRQKADELLNYILFAPNSHKISFLQAFFDDEGCITFTGKKRLIRGYQHSLPVLKLIKKLLADFYIDSRIDEKYYELYISKRHNLLKFQKLINFTPEVRVNGGRSNSIWKKSLEKRKILNIALDSYKLC